MMRCKDCGSVNVAWDKSTRGTPRLYDYAQINALRADGKTYSQITKITGAQLATIQRALGYRKPKERAANEIRSKR